MKKWLSLLLAAFMLLSLAACTGEKEENPYRMKTQTIDRYLVGERTSQMKFSYRYDEEGYLAQTVYSLDGEMTETDTFENDAYGNIVRCTLKSADGATHIYEYKLTLDAKHRIIREEAYWDGRLDGITEMAYDRQGNQTQLNITRIYVDTEDLISWVDYAYDSSGNLIEETKRWNDGDSSITKSNATNVSRTAYQYEDGKCVRSETYGSKDKLVSYSEYTYDETGLIQTQLHYEADGSEDGKTINTYDEYGNLLVCEIYGAWDPVTESYDDLAERITTYTYERITPES